MLWGAGAGQNASIPPDTHLSIAFMTSCVVCGLCPLKKKGKKKSEELSPKSTHLPKGGIIEIGRTDAEAEASILWPPDAKN